MKKLLIVLVVIIAAAAGGYSYLWNQKAEDFKQVVVEAIDRVNALAKPHVDGQDVVKYESLSTSGWPLQVEVKIHKPTLMIPLHVLAENLEKASANETQGLGDNLTSTNPPVFKAAKGIKWTETITSNVMTVGTNVTATTLTLDYGSEITGVSNYNGEIDSPRISTFSSPNICSLSVVSPAEGQSFFDVRKTLGDGKDFLKRFRSLECQVKGWSTVDGKSKEMLVSGESAAFSIAYDGSNSAKGIGQVTGSAVNQKATKAYDALVTRYLSRFYKVFMDQEIGVMSGWGTPLSEAGSNNVEFSASFEAPTDPALFLSKEMTMRAGIDSFKVRNDLMNVDFSLILRSSPDATGEKRDSAIVMSSSTAVTERYDELKRQEILAVLDLISKDPTAETKVLQEAMKKLSAEEWKAAVNDLWPQFHPLGNMVFSVDISTLTPNPFAPSGDLTVKHLDFVNALDGIRINAKATQQGLIPTGEAAITCLNCEGLLNRIYDYSKRLDKWIPKFDETYEVPMISEALHQGVNAFLKSISVAAKDGTGKENPKDWLFAIRMPENEEPTLNGKPLSTLMEAFATHIAPHLTTPAESHSHEELPPSEYQPEEQVTPPASQ